MKKRILALLLCLATVFTMLPSTGVAAEDTAAAAETAESEVTILRDGTPTSELLLYRDEKVLLSAEPNNVADPVFQWQILLDAQNNAWVNIFDKTEAQCEVSYTVVKNLLDTSGSSYIRCAVSCDGQTIYSDPICVTILFTNAPTEPAAPQPMQLLSDLYILPFNTQAPAADESTAVQQTEPAEILNENEQPDALPQEAEEKTTASAADAATDAIAVPSVEASVNTAPEQENAEEPSMTAVQPEEDAPAVFSEHRIQSAQPTSANADGTAEYVTVMIKYLDASSLNGVETAIYSPYTATIEKGSNFTQNVVSPTFLGFAPFYDADTTDANTEIDDDASTVSLNFTNVAQNVEICVYYKPIKVNYATRYFFQNINDDLYTEDVTRYHTGQAETGSIIEDSYLKAQAGNTTGFEKMYHIPESVAADGSTVFECYYDRNYYLINFDANGGYGVEPIYARYGTPFIVNDPIRHGYVFNGWKLVAVDTNNDSVWETTLPDDALSGLISTIPAYSCYYEAQWTTIGTTASIVYWLEDPDVDGKYNYWQTEPLNTVISGSTIYGKDYSDITTCSWYTNTTNAAATYQFYEYNSTKTENEPGVVVEGNGSSVVNVYYDRKEYSIQFIFARQSGTTYQNASNTDSDDYASVNWGNRTLNTDNWNTVTSSTNPECKSFTINGWTYYYFEITDKYGARIDDEWVKINNLLANNPIVSNNVYVSWRTNSNSGYGRSNTNKNIKGAYPYMDTQMIITNSTSGMVTNSTHTMTAYNNSGVSYYQYEIYFYNTVKQQYELENAFIVNPTSAYNQQTTFQYIGMTHVQTEYFDRDTEGNLVEENNAGSRPNGKNSADYPAIIKFYYQPTNYTLQFFNHNAFVDALKKTADYNTLLSAYRPNGDPIYPSTLEENAYTFNGWYASPGCYAGTEVNWDTDTMPAQDYVLYAKWIPKTHTVNFFTTLDEMKGFEANASSVTPYKSFVGITHGNVVGSIDNPSRTDTSGSDMNLVFGGWFYLENGQKKAFSPTDMPINRDMNVFADWSSHTPTPYRINYVLLKNPTKKVADDTVGFAYIGTTRTFTAKAGEPYNQLYENYNQGYFPTISSHSITMQYEADHSNLQQNTDTFYYVEAQNIEYTVRYINKETNVVMDTVTHTTSSAVVTERFKAYENMVPDAFYKRLVISVEWDEEQNKYVGTDDNVITFYYTPNKTSAYYAVHFMLEKLHDPSLPADKIAALQAQYKTDGTGGYEETGTHVEGVGNVNSTISIIPQIFSGFELIPNAAVTKIGEAESNATYVNSEYRITVSADGTELYIFYKRKSFDYTVHYYQYNTTEPVDSVNAPSKTGSALYGSSVTEKAKEIDNYTCVSAQTQTIPIRENEAQNIIIFYYAPLQYVAEYVAVPEEGGWLSSTIEVIAGSEDLEGSEPTANPFYRFEGWYLDEECIQPVTAETGTVEQDTNRFTPDKNKLSETERNIFYAKFSLQVGDLTITRQNATDDDQVFVYEVKNTSTGEIIYVTVTGNGSTTINNLVFGNYTVTQLNDWSWRHADSPLSFAHQGSSGTTVQFSAAESSTGWLNGNSNFIHNRRGYP